MMLLAKNAIIFMLYEYHIRVAQAREAAMKVIIGLLNDKVKSYSAKPL
jgi:hypothetical protein